MSEAMLHEHEVERPRLVLRGGPLVAVLASLAVAALLVMLVLVSSGDGAPVAMIPAADEDPEPEAGPDDAPDETEAPETDLEAMPAVTYEIYLARDPFDPVVPEEEPTPAEPTPDDPDDPDAPVPDPDDPDAPSPAPSDDPTIDPNDDPATPRDPDRDRCMGDEELVCDGHVVSLMDIVTKDGERLAVLQVDSTIYEVREGEVFADRFKLLDIGQDEVRLQFGDDVRTVEHGEHVLK